MIARLNEQFDLSGKRKLAKSTLYRQAKNGMAGESPPKMGPPPKIPPIFLEVLSTHAQICQVSNGELKGKDIRRLIGASTVGSGFEDNRCGGFDQLQRSYGSRWFWQLQLPRPS